MINNFLAEVPEFFLENNNFTTISSLESSNPAVGNAVSGNYYLMRVKMFRSMDQPNELMNTCFEDLYISPPQDLQWKYRGRETMTMYSRSSAFGPPCFGGGHGIYGPKGSGDTGDDVRSIFSGSDSFYGFNWAYTPPYYHGEAWCDLIFRPKETKKYSIDEIINEVKEWPYYTRFWWYGENDTARDLYEPNPLSNLSSLTLGDYASYPRSIFGSEYSGRYKNYGFSPWTSMIMHKSSYDRFSNPVNAVSTIARTGSNWGTVPVSIMQAIQPPRVPGGYAPAVTNPRRSFGLYHPYYLNYNALQLDASINIFGKAILRKNTIREVSTI